MTRTEKYIELQSALQYLEAGQEDMAEECLRVLMDGYWGGMDSADRIKAKTAHVTLDAELNPPGQKVST